MIKVSEEIEYYQKRVELLEQALKKSSATNIELNQKNGELFSENNTMQKMLCEKYEIIPEVLKLNIKLYNREAQVRSKQMVIKSLKAKLEEFEKNA